MGEIDVFGPQLSRIMHESWQEYNILKVYILIGLLVGNVGLWPAKTLELRRVTQDLCHGGPLEVLTIAKLIKILILILI